MFRHFALRTFLPLVAVAVVCVADAHAEEVSVQVNYAGLDLSTPSGISMVQSRMAQAVNAACGWADSRDLQSMRRIRECRADLVAKFEPKLVAEVDALQSRLTASLPVSAPVTQ